MNARLARFAIGQLVRHRLFPFRGVVFDVDPEFANSDDWWLAIPEPVRPRKAAAPKPGPRSRRAKTAFEIPPAR